MRVYGIIIFLITFLIVIPDIYIYRRFIYHRVRKSIGALHWVISAYFTIVTLTILFHINTIISPETTYHFMIFVGALGAVYIPKLIFITFDLIFFLTKKKWRKIQHAGYIFAVIAFFAIIYAIGWGRFNFHKKEYSVEIENLPEVFDGYKIVQISDMHLGSFSNFQKRVKPLFDSINEENADMIVFTGDMVNNFASETTGWESLFRSLNQKGGMLAILGNHDYSLYYQWEDEELRNLNQQGIKKSIRDFGFDLLLNQSFVLEKGADKIAFIGVENWGHSPFPQYANLTKAIEGVEDIQTKILLSHDPDFWQDSILGKQNIVLTLSGHTHAAQIGIDIGSIKFSPVQFKYKYWDGLYEENNQYISVSRGVGCAGIPARLGMSPEYTVIILKQKKNNIEKL